MAKKSMLSSIMGGAEAAKPDHNEMLADRAHAAHRDVVEGWVKGEKTEKHVKQSKERLGKVLEECGK